MFGVAIRGVREPDATGPLLGVATTGATRWRCIVATLAISLLFAVSLYLAGAVLLLGLSWFFVERAFNTGIPEMGLGYRVRITATQSIMAIFCRPGIRWDFIDCRYCSRVGPCCATPWTRPFRKDWT